jgi:hypothetical protein
MLYTHPFTNELHDTSYSRLRKLQYWLKYELSSSLLFLLSFFGLMFVFVLVFFALIFTPFMLYVLYKEKRKGWIIFFFILISSPFVLLFAGSQYLLVAGFLSLATFYLFCFLLKFASDEWVKERGFYLTRMNDYKAKTELQDSMN